jgi:hypothetical protein
MKRLERFYRYTVLLLIAAYLALSCCQVSFYKTLPQPVVAGLVAAALYGAAAALWPRRRQPSPRWQPLRSPRRRSN